MKIRVMHCLETIGPGGVEQRRLSIARYLNKNRYEQLLTCSKVIGDFDKKLEEAGTVVKRLGVMGNPFNWGYYRRLLREIRAFRPHIIHGAVFEGVLSAVVGGSLSRVPSIVVEETSEPANRSWRGHWLFRQLAGRADIVIATSPAVYEYITRKIHVPESKARLVLNGVEPTPQALPEEVAMLRGQLGLQAGHYVIGSVGRMLDNHKLFSVLIRAFASFRATHAEARLLLVGDGVDKDMLVQLAASLGLTESVIFAGHQQEVYKYYALMNVFALVPAREGFGLAAVEAMFAGLPVIATRVGGLQFIVSHEVSGLLVEPGNQQGLEVALKRLHQDPAFAASLGKEGQQMALSRFTAKRYVADLELIYDQLSERIIK